LYHALFPIPSTLRSLSFFYSSHPLPSRPQDPTADRSIESLFAELVSNGLIQPCPKVHVQDYLGHPHVLGYQVQAATGEPGDPAMAQVIFFTHDLPMFMCIATQLEFTEKERRRREGIARGSRGAPPWRR
jgi:hypothetical protein